MSSLTHIPCPDFPRMIGQRWTVRDWIYLDVCWSLGNGRLLFARVPEQASEAHAAPFVVVCVSLAKVGWDVDGVEYFDSLAIAMRATFAPWTDRAAWENGLARERQGVRSKAYRKGLALAAEANKGGAQ